MSAALQRLLPVLLLGVAQSAADICAGGSRRFLFNRVSHNNLGGAGPDKSSPRALVFDQAATFGGQCVRLYVSLSPKSAPYKSQNTHQNGAANDQYMGRLNLMSGSSASFIITLRDCETLDEVTIPHFNLTFHALNVLSQEKITVNGYKAAYQSQSDLFSKEYTPDGTTFTSKSPCDKDLNGGACGLTFYFDTASAIPVQLTAPGVEGFGRLFYFSASGCNNVDAPRGTCSNSACGEDYALKPGALDKKCMDVVCSRAECCNLKEDRMSYPLVQSCQGTERSWRSCPNLPDCNSCVPVNCVFQEWSEWSPLGGCSGLCKRTRATGENNECGNPCSGPTEETVVRLEDPLCYPAHCNRKDQDCMWSQWNEWTKCNEECNVCLLGQRFRHREVYQSELGSGRACLGPYNETKPCQAEHAIDCEMSTWGEWTTCSKPCDMGWKARMRRVVQEAQFGGKACGADEFYNQGMSTRQTLPCNIQACGDPTPCVLSDWSSWEGCSRASPYQKFRFRDVLQTEMNGGKPCDVDLNQTAGCPEPDEDKPKAPCEFSDWTGWTKCSAPCGGQMHRERKLNGESDQCVLHGQASNTGAALKETMACGHRECNHVSCRLSAWTEWSQCSSDCGVGATFRHRKILEIGDTTGCNTALEEVRACSLSDCKGIDCKWGDWDPWGACTCSCDGGIKRRNRIIKVAPRNGGRLCSPEDKNEVAPCNTQACSQCVNGQWGVWGDWGTCSGKCAPAFKVRHRNVAVHPNSCGKPAAGLEDDYQLCDHLSTCESDQDCQLSTWGAWTSCSCKCFGVQERQRNVAQYARGKGKSCADKSLKEVKACNPATGESPPGNCKPDKQVACVLGSWEEWSKCSASCDGGQKTRIRHILSPAGNGGAPCEDILAETANCSTNSCKHGICIDCIWGAWAEWGDCTKCGGQRFRHRNIRQMPNKCGKACDARPAKELGSCSSQCEKKFYCAWSDWESMGHCTKTCGTGSHMRQRQLSLVESQPAGGAFFEAQADSTCSGSQIDSEDCKGLMPCESCTKQDCIFKEWSDWTTPTCTQLCERHRHVAQQSACGGKNCMGPLMETKKCPHECRKPLDCLFGNWGDWEGECHEANKQRERRRGILQPAMNGGEQCSGATMETRPCGGLKTVDCSMEEWCEWSSCTATCDGGIRLRKRGIAVHARGGGNPCNYSLAEVAQCSMLLCHGNSKDCVLNEWDAWTSCEDADMSYRFRRITQQPQNGGITCNGPLREAMSCLNKVDCQTSGWTEWDQCDKSCGGGQRTRHRQVTRNPLNGGDACPHRLIETAGCNAVPCQTRDCIVSAWGQWADCSATCGVGYRIRSRDFQQRPCKGGRGCNMTLAQTEPCDAHTMCGCIDCVWDSWTEWKECDKPCDGGQTTRTRKIITKPEPGCKACDAKVSSQVKPCNTQVCSHHKCIDGLWNDWEEWGICSSTCDGGEVWRSRKMLQEANDCGIPATGLATEARKCNVGVPCVPAVDCMFGDWTRWSECSGKCLGVRERSRKILAYAKGNGLYCAGPLKQTAPCHHGGGLLDFTDPGQLLLLNHVRNNNLGGQGPFGLDGEAAFEPTMRFRNVGELPTDDCKFPAAGTCSGRMIDLVISESGSKGYTACSVDSNGRYEDGFGEINVAGNTGGTFSFKLVDSATDEAVTARRLMLKFYGLTQGPSGDSQMVIHSHNSKDYFVPKGTTVAVSGGTHNANGVTFASSADASRGGEELPSSPREASQDQEARTVSLQFDDSSEAIVSLHVSHGESCQSFLFAAKACLGEEPCEIDTCSIFDKPPVDCVVSDWSYWEPCTHTCGVGQQSRNRKIIQYPVRGGFGCSEALSVTRECIARPCHNECQPVDCQYSDWAMWGACDRCGGQQRRTRHITAHPLCGGAACRRSNVEEVTNCTRICRDKTFCVWSDWGDYGPCTETCGAGLQARERRLMAQSQLPGIGSARDFASTYGVGKDFEMKFQELHVRAEKMETNRIQVLALSFTAGCASLAAVFGMVRVLGRKSWTERSVSHYDSDNDRAP